MPQPTNQPTYQPALYAFSLGRENKLSLAELIVLFGESAYRNHTDEIAVFSLSCEDSTVSAIFRNIGGSIRAMRILCETDEKKFPTDVISYIGRPDGKYTYALGVYGGEYPLSDIGLRIKKTLIESGISARLVNTENKNIVSAAWKKEKLGRSKSEYNLIHLPSTNLRTSYLAITIACQDIDAYAKRDTGKSRDMVVGMMPPKLCQMMINLATQDRKQLSGSSYQKGKPESDTGYLVSNISIYDPFCGLGTILIEAANMGYTRLYGSDLSPRMVESTRRSLDEFVKEERVWQERIRSAGGTPSKDFTDFHAEIFELDASKIGRWSGWHDGQPANNLTGNNTNLQTYKPTNLPTSIVSEGYLGEIMSRESISVSRVNEEKRKLKIMYDGFFGGLCGMDFSGNIVMTFPCWDVRGEIVSFSEIYDVIGRHGFAIVPLLPIESMRTMMTAKGTLLYRRPGQTVGREVIKIRKK